MARSLAIPPDTPVLCLAAGSGLAPILALTEAALRRSYRPPVTLLFSAQTEKDIYCQGQMAWWKARHRRFRFLTTLTREQQEGHLHGRIPKILPGLFPDLAQHQVFIAGTPEFTEDCVAACVALGARRQISIPRAISLSTLRNRAGQDDVQRLRVEPNG